MNRYINGIKKINQGLNTVSADYERGKLYFWMDAFRSYLRFGVTPNEYLQWHFYKYSSLERAEYYTARKANRLEKKLNQKDYVRFFQQKEEFNQKFQAFVKRDWLYVPKASDSQVENFLTAHPKVVVKPVNLSSGRGIRLYERESVEKLRKDKALLEEFVVQHPDIAEIHPFSVNTVRVYSILDQKKTPHIISAVLRVGGGKSVTDNQHNGGVAYPIDLESGCICGAGVEVSGKYYFRHPETDFLWQEEQFPIGRNCCYL